MTCVVSGGDWTLDVPAEILVESFKRGAARWGVGFLPRLCLVSRFWNNVVKNTPALWGYIVAQWKIPAMDTCKTLTQIQRSKTARIHLRVASGAALEYSRYPGIHRFYIIKDVAGTQRCLSIDIGTDFLWDSRWISLYPSLVHLTLNHIPPSAYVDAIAATSVNDIISSSPSFPSSRLESFTMHGVPSRWAQSFYSPSLLYLSFRRWSTHKYSTADLIRHLALSPNLKTVEIEGHISLFDGMPEETPDITSPPTVGLSHLSNLVLTNVIRPSNLLYFIRAPSLQLLTVRVYPARVWVKVGRLSLSDPTLNASFSRVIHAWTQQPSTIPTKLRSLTLIGIVHTTADLASLVTLLGVTPKLTFVSIGDHESMTQGMKANAVQAAVGTPDSVAPPPIACAPALSTIYIHDFSDPGYVLGSIHVPSLETLKVSRRQREYTTNPFDDGEDDRRSTQPSTPNIPISLPAFREWTRLQPAPRKLRVLALDGVLRTPADVADLIELLSLTPQLFSLSLEDNVVSQAARSGDASRNLFLALSDPNQSVVRDQGAQRQPSRGWLCPSLRELRLNVGEEVEDVLLAVRGRGASWQKGAERLRLVQMTSLCPSATYEAWQELTSLADSVQCMCFGCGLFGFFVHSGPPPW